MFFDSNVLIDVLSQDPIWSGWSSEQLARADKIGGGAINIIVVAELSPGYDSVEELRKVLQPLSLRVIDVAEDAAFEAGRAFGRWRRTRSVDAGRRVLADFLIGAHATALRLPLVTRDPTIYRRIFPDLPLITPETHP
ncbi:type II toxin-antitoxin system VapC family toxin [Sphingomonas sp.]|jgi:hypothetical protein|uniref:type II toxin-antitoxin system VapC family toxin n=1 Tax=Sphingomonas sp. TaxID=28214 RepID=UPI002ED885DE